MQRTLSTPCVLGFTSSLLGCCSLNWLQFCVNSEDSIGCPPIATCALVGFSFAFNCVCFSLCWRSLSNSSPSGRTMGVNATICFNFGPQIRRGYPPNLSISLSGGKETKEDSPSNGERTGISPAPNRAFSDVAECGVWERHFLALSVRPSPLERGPFP